MIRSLRTTLNPAWYHGHGKSPPFFEEGQARTIFHGLGHHAGLEAVRAVEQLQGL